MNLIFILNRKMTGLLLLKDSFALNQRKNISEFNKKMRYQLMKKSYKCRYHIVDLIEMLFHSQTTDRLHKHS